MENLRLGVSAVRHDMKREETVEEAEKNTELGRQTPKRQAVGSNPARRASLKSGPPGFETKRFWWRFVSKPGGCLFWMPFCLRNFQKRLGKL